ncbi:MAG: L,D-transpeptidase family protein [Cyclobacteriaceae bacterium]
MKITFQIQLFLAAFLLFSSACTGSREVSVDKELISQFLSDLKTSAPNVNPEIFSHLEHIYNTAGYQLIWNDNTKDAAHEILGKAEIHGLSPADYKYEELKKRKEEPGKSDNEVLETDMLYTYAMLQFGRHMIEGRTDPEDFEKVWHYERRDFNDTNVDSLLKALNEDNLQLYVSEVIPEGGYYEGLMLWMQRYLNGDFDHIRPIGFDEMPVEKGAAGQDIVELKYRLSQYDSYSGDKPSDVFDDELESAIIEFQKKNGLPSDGVIGQGTLDALNLSPEEKKDIVRINMERARWLLHTLPEKFLLVNIAGYDLVIFDDLKRVYKTPVIVGKVHHETPIFHSELEYIEFNCTWTVPRSISGEILASIKKNPDYLSSRHFEVLSGESVVDPSGINWDEYSRDNLPYVFRQKPGPWNSLGTMKFIFPNEYSVYLHDTPTKYLFVQEGTRAFSHGCVRVKNPKELAAFILKDQNVSESEIDDILASQETKRILLENKLPIYLTYWTVFPEFPFDDPETMHFVKDVYGRDEPILKALNQASSASGQLTSQ